MRTLLRALSALACLHGPALAQQQQTFTVDQGRPGGAPWPVTWAPGLAVAADLRVGGAAVAAGNPVPVAVGNLPAVQPVSGTVTANQGGAPWSIGGAVTATLSQGGSALAADNPIFARVTNLPETQTVAGTVSVGNLPAVQAVSAADGADATRGAKADAAATDGTGAWSVVALLKGIYTALLGPIPAGGNTIGRIASGVTPSDLSGTLAPNAGALILPADAARQFLAITNTGANPMLYRFGTAGPTAPAGHVLAAGATVVFDAKVPNSGVTALSAAGTTYFITSGN